MTSFRAKIRERLRAGFAEGEAGKQAVKAGRVALGRVVKFSMSRGPKTRSALLQNRVVAVAAQRGRRAYQEVREQLPLRGPREVTTISLEHGFVKLMVTHGLQVLDFRIAPTSSRFFREGLVSNSPGMAGILKNTLVEMAGSHRRIIGAVPGYQTALRGLELPNARGLNPRVVIPREAQKLMGVSSERSVISWHPLYNGRDRTTWLVMSATRRSVTSLVDTAQRANVKMSAIELRPFALARAANQPDAVIVWTAADGCDVVVMRDSMPLAHQAAYWGAEPAVEGHILVNRLSEVVEQTTAAHDEQNPEMLLPEDTPLVVSGSPLNADPAIATQLAAILGRPLSDIVPAFELPSDFPVNDLIVNIGLALWGA